MPDMLASMYFKTEDPITGKLFRFQPDVRYSWTKRSMTVFSFTTLFALYYPTKQLLEPHPHKNYRTKIEI